MNFSHFFIDRPIFATVLSAIIVLIGGIAMSVLPVDQYPPITPPTVSVTAFYPGANAQTVAETVAAPIEREINGVENMLYLSSQNSADGALNMTVTFKLGTDLDQAQVLVQNRVSTALPKLPEEVRRTGVVVKKQSPDMMMLIALSSPDGRYSRNYTDNYAQIQLVDRLSRLEGVGSVTVFGSEYAMRIWFDPERLASLGMTASEVVASVSSQNTQIAAGTLGAMPSPADTPFQFTLNAQGRLLSKEEFESIIIKRGDHGSLVRLSDVARVELGSKDYNIVSSLNNHPTTLLGIFQLPGSNALATAELIHTTMEEFKKEFPEGLEYSIPYNTTIFIEESVNSVKHTLFEAIVLVILVVVLFLQNWRATIIPLVAVPVSLIGTFAVMALMGFSLNNISLFGLVLAIGIVVDDAILVVENVERNMNLGLKPRAATLQAMREVSGPIVAVCAVLIAVFLPTAFISGISGQFYRQFAVTIAVSTVISAFNSLTLSPALSALLLKPHHAKKDWLEKVMQTVLGGFFRVFNRFFDVSIERYGKLVGGLTRRAAIVLLLYAGLLGATWYGFKVVPGGFIPNQDKGYAIVAGMLPDAANRQRSDALGAEVSKALKEIPGVADAILISGYSMLSGSNSPNSFSIFTVFEPFDQRKNPEKSADQIIATARKKLRAFHEGLILTFGPPPVSGMGNVGGFALQLQDRAGLGFEALQGAVQRFAAAANEQPGLTSVSSTYRPNAPQYYIEIDREKAETMGVPVTNIFQTLQVYLGSAYVNDFTLSGRSFQVLAQADAAFRGSPDDIALLQTRNDAGEMVPLGSLVTVRDTYGPSNVNRYNLYNAADLNGDTAPGFSSGQAIATIEELARRELPTGIGYEWTGLTLQQILAGNTAIFIFPLCVLLVFLVLAAQYESWSMPLSIILIVPMVLLSSLVGLYIAGKDNNIFTQIGFVVLVGLAAKNAILIVEFARQLQHEKNLDRYEAAVEACRLRLRPILMTSMAFICGVIPLVISKGAGAEMRNDLGLAVFSGMLGVTFFGLLLTPVFYVVIMKFAKKKANEDEDDGDDEPEAEAPALEASVK